ncbi:MAG TPA: hypothetical protein VLJ39_06365 [Tepidisphaeraceae bacterium]|nr:hypothetical protein [Tepidisphaeraceae bacterium]
MDHQRIDERSLAFGEAIARHLQQKPELIALARANVVRWLGTCSPRLESTLREWLTALDGPVEGVIDLLTSRDERATRLRQSNPFAGALPQDERNEILLRFQSNDAARA